MRICLGQQAHLSPLDSSVRTPTRGCPPVRVQRDLVLPDTPAAELLPYSGDGPVCATPRRTSTEWAGAEGQKGREQIIPKALLTLYVKGGLWVKMTEAGRDA
ncbi:hypothetical protein C8Q80DRAFT_1157840 [Daedaleopsis nitida]|nr:hypothetical protein C8Q80DRAFT_1157840 [Daedaleopsis nitida]